MAPRSPFDWTAFEAELHDELALALADVGRARPEARFYAVALHGLYRELDGLLSLPHLAAAIDGALPASEGFWSAYWSPGDWELSEIDLRPAPALRLERALTREANRDTQAHWRDVEARYLELLVRVAVRLRDRAPSLLSTTDDFVLFINDEALGPDFAARTMPPALVARFFAPDVARTREHERVVALPVAERVSFLVTRLVRYDGRPDAVSEEAARNELVAIGEPALDALLPVLGHPKHGWSAAIIIGKIGVSRPDVLAALRKRAPKSLWHASALGMLGDYDWLASQPDFVVGHGFTATLRAICQGRPRPLDYRPLERFLDGASATATARVEEELAPGKSYVEAQTADVPEALRGLASPHAVIRWHAASLLGERGLGARVGKTVLPALAATLSDGNEIVRRLAVLAIGDWKAAAKPYREAIARLRDDPDEAVRRSVAHTLDSRPV
jgi:hypothetical protein